MKWTVFSICSTTGAHIRSEQNDSFITSCERLLYSSSQQMLTAAHFFVSIILHSQVSNQLVNVGKPWQAKILWFLIFSSGVVRKKTTFELKEWVTFMRFSEKTNSKWMLTLLHVCDFSIKSSERQNSFTLRLIHNLCSVVRHVEPETFIFSGVNNNLNLLAAYEFLFSF